LHQRIFLYEHQVCAHTPHQLIKANEVLHYYLWNSSNTFHSCNFSQCGIQSEVGCCYKRLPSDNWTGTYINHCTDNMSTLRFCIFNLTCFFYTILKVHQQIESQTCVITKVHAICTSYNYLSYWLKRLFQNCLNTSCYCNVFIFMCALFIS
jgi:hypothetical protein